MKSRDQRYKLINLININSIKQILMQGNKLSELALMILSVITEFAVLHILVDRLNQKSPESEIYSYFLVFANSELEIVYLTNF